MTVGEEKLIRWQFGIRGLLVMTAIVAAITCAYCINSTAGFFLAIALFAVWGGVSLRRIASDEERLRTYGVLGAIGGGAAAGIGQIAVFFLGQWMIGPLSEELEGFSLIQTLLLSCPIAAVIGGSVGVSVWALFRGVVHCTSRVTHGRVFPPTQIKDASSESIPTNA